MKKMNIGEWITKRAIIQPGRPFLTEKNKTYSNRRFNEQVNMTAHAFSDLGIKKGDRVALLMSNCAEFLEIFFACGKTGAILVPLNFRLAPPELIYILNDSKPVALIYSSEFFAKVQEIKKAAFSIKQYIGHGEEIIQDDIALSGYVDSFSE